MRQVSFRTPAILISVLLAMPAYAQVDYSTILGANEGVTGVRGDVGGAVLLTGSYHDASGNSQGLLYRGPISPTNPGGYSYITPPFAGEQSSIFYGPDTSLFDPSIGAGDIRVVGSFETASDSDRQGMLYQGSFNGVNPPGSNAWTVLDLPSQAVGGAVVKETVPHSIMGSLIVGNYTLQSGPLSANAFLYNITTQQWTIFDLGGTANETTAYGIWQNGIGSDSYTIAGGTEAGLGINKGYLIDYNSATGAFSDLRLFSYLDQPGVVTHFEGITAAPGGFNLSATTDDGPALAFVAVNPDGSFGNATWTLIDFPGSSLSTGTTVFEDTALGNYALPGSSTIYSYAAQVSTAPVPEPSSFVLIMLGLATTVLLFRRNASGSNFLALLSMSLDRA